MAGMFSCAKSFNQPLNDWDVSNVKYMQGMFSNAELFNQNLEQWEVSSSANVSCMFNKTKLKRIKKIPKWFKILTM